MPLPGPSDRWPHTGAVLAGGGSRRMGRPKHALRLADGTTMIEAVTRALAELCRQVVVAGAVETSLKSIADLRPGAGPLGGIEALLASGLDTQYLVCPCDLPLVTATLLRRLTEVSGAVATVFRVAGEPDFWPLPARLSATALDRVRQHLDGGRGAVHELMRTLDPEVVVVERQQAQVLANINTPSDYEALR